MEWFLLRIFTNLEDLILLDKLLYKGKHNLKYSSPKNNLDMVLEIDLQHLLRE